MALTYTWKITNLRKVDQMEGLSDVVVHARWTRTGVDENGHDGTFTGATPLRAPSSGSNFTSFESLTEEQIIDWIKSEITANPGYEEHIVGQITKQIDAKKRPVIEVELLPWGVQAVSTSAVSPGIVETVTPVPTGSTVT